jgi:hypothetical protein
MTNEEFAVIASEVAAYNETAYTQIKAYVDAGDAKSLADAKVYVDSLIGAGVNVQELLNAINAIRDALDGDAENPGLQMLNSLLAQVADHAARIAALETASTAHEASITELEQAVATNATNAQNALDTESTARQTADNALSSRITTTENNIASIQTEMGQFVTGAQLAEVFSAAKDLVLAKFALPQA